MPKSNETKQLEVSQDGDVLVIRIPIRKHPSKSGKSMNIATTGGNKATALVVDGQPLVVGVNAYIPIAA